MDTFRSDFLFPHRRCMPHYSLDDYSTISQYYFKLFKVGVFLYQLFHIVDA